MQTSLWVLLQWEYVVRGNCTILVNYTLINCFILKGNLVHFDLSLGLFAAPESLSFDCDLPLETVLRITMQRGGRRLVGGSLGTWPNGLGSDC